MAGIDPDGLDAVIFWGQNQYGHGGANPSFFLNAAKVAAYDYEESHYKCSLSVDDRGSLNFSESQPSAHIVKATNIQDMISALSMYTNIDTIEYFGHAGSPALYLSHNQALTASQVNSLPTTNVLPNATIRLVGCDTAGSMPPGKPSIAQAFANHFHTNVNGYKGGLSFFGPYPRTFIFGDATPTSVSPN